MLAGGIPTRTKKHADNVADMALKMLEIIKSIPNPSTTDQCKHLEIRTGNGPLCYRTSQASRLKDAETTGKFAYREIALISLDIATSERKYF